MQRHRRQERKTIKYKSDITHSQFEGENIKKEKRMEMMVGDDDDENENKCNNIFWCMKRATNKCNDDDFHADKLTDDYQYIEKKRERGEVDGW